MQYPRPSSRIHPKISTLPRQRSEAAHYLDLYKLTVEKTRLKQELSHIEKRRDRIQERLSILEQQISDVEHAAQRLRQSGAASAPNSIVYPPAYYSKHSNRDDASFETITLDY